MSKSLRGDSSIECSNRHSTEWSVLDGCELACIDKAKRVLTFKPGETLYNQGEAGNGIYCIKSGLIGLRRVDVNGNSVLLRLSTAGCTVGYRTFLTKQPHANSAEVLTSSLVCYIARPQVEAMLKGNPRLGERFLQHFTDDAIATENDYVRSMTMGMKSRFLHLILVFYERFDKPGPALLRTSFLKGLHRGDKIRIIEQHNPGWRDLYDVLLLEKHRAEAAMA